MAKRCEQMNAMAEDRAAGAEILTLKSIRAFSVSLGDIRRVRETKRDGTPGRVVKQVHLLNCACRVAGRQKPIETQIEMEAGDYGFKGELEQCLIPAVAQFVAHVVKVRLGEIKEAEAPLNPDELPPLPSDRKPSKANQERGKALAAVVDAKRERTTTNGAEPEQGGEA